MSQEIKKILPVIFLIAAIGLGWLSWQEYQEVLTMQNQMKEAEDKTVVLSSAVEKTNKFVSYAKANPEALEKINIILPDDSNKPGMVYFLASAVMSNGLLLKTVNFSDSREAQTAADQGGAPPVSEEKPAAQDIKLVFSGTYSSLKNFLIFAGKSLKLMDVVSISFGSKEKEQDKSQIANYDFSVNLKSYYLAKNDSDTKETKILLANNLVDLSFTKEKKFTDLMPPQNYNIDTTDTGDWGNKNIF